MSWPQITIALLLLIGTALNIVDEARKPQPTSTAAAMILANVLYGIVFALILGAGGFW